MFENLNLKDYIAKAVVLKKEINETKDKKNIFGTFLMLFPTAKDQMICRAVFDIMFSDDLAARKVLDKMINSMNVMAPQKMTDMSDVYSEALAMVVQEKEKQEKQVNDNITDGGGERYTGESKQGSEKNDDKNGRASDPFIVMNTIDPNRDYKSGEIIYQKGEKTISTLSSEELNAAKIANDNVQRARMQKQIINAEEERKRRAYEESLKRRNKAKTGKAIISAMQEVARAKD